MFTSLCFCYFFVFQATSVLSEGPSVIIVGAGPSGLAAAVRLIENSIRTITILEAENRIGGRINTTEFGEGVVDIGAEYCHGEEGNAVYQTVKDLNLLQHSHVINPETNKMYYSNGSIIEHDLAKELDSAIYDYSTEIKMTDHVNLENAFLSFWNSTILEKYSNDSSKLKIVKDTLKFAHNVILMHEGSFHWRSPASGRHYRACSGDPMMTWKTGGYRSFLNVLLKRYPDPSQAIPIENYTVFNNKVSKIAWNSDKVRVESANADYILEADHVIFTPSVGVLRADHDELFEPGLPQRKLEAIDSMGFDAILKILMHFPEKWWNDDDKTFYLVWSSEDLGRVVDEFDEGPSKNGIPWVTHIVALITVPNQPNVLTAWVSGDLIPEIENTSEEIIKKGVFYVIEKFLSRDYNVSVPDEVIWSHWFTNSNFRGTFSYEKVEYWAKNISYQKIFSEPLENNNGVPVVLFAGEATNPVVYSTVHGAVDAGRREADRIINLHKK